MSKTIEVTVEVNLGEIDDEDLAEELSRRSDMPAAALGALNRAEHLAMLGQSRAALEELAAAVADEAPNLARALRAAT